MLLSRFRVRSEANADSGYVEGLVFVAFVARIDPFNSLKTHVYRSEKANLRQRDYAQIFLAIAQNGGLVRADVRPVNSPRVWPKKRGDNASAIHRP